MVSHKVVVLYTNFAFAFGREVARGVSAYGAEAGWYLYADPGAAGKSVSQQEQAFLESGRVSGAVVFAASPRIIEMFQGLDIPIVNVSNALPQTPFPRVGADDVAAGRLAAEHFLGHGLRHFAFATDMDQHFCQQRLQGFQERLRAAGFDCAVFRVPPPAPDSTGSLEARMDRIHDSYAAWLRSLPKPVGILAANDLTGTTITVSCRLNGLQVPEEIAVIGVDNDEAICELSNPPLSSVAFPLRRIGFEAGALLDRLMNGAAAPAAPILLPPSSVITRQSSNLLAIDDADLAAALRFIQEHWQEPINVTKVARALSISARSLQLKFQLHLNRGPSEEIARVRIEKARQLLTTTDMPISEIAQRTGLSKPDRLTRLVRKQTGLTPREFRRNYRVPTVPTGAIAADRAAASPTAGNSGWPGA